MEPGRGLVLAPQAVQPAVPPLQHHPQRQRGLVEGGAVPVEPGHVRGVLVAVAEDDPLLLALAVLPGHGTRAAQRGRRQQHRAAHGRHQAARGRPQVSQVAGSEGAGCKTNQESPPHSHSNLKQTPSLQLLHPLKCKHSSSDHTTQAKT